MYAASPYKDSSLPETALVRHHGLAKWLTAHCEQHGCGGHGNAISPQPVS